MLITLLALLKQVIMSAIAILLAIAILALLANLASRVQKREEVSTDERSRVEGDR